MYMIDKHYFSNSMGRANYAFALFVKQISKVKQQSGGFVLKPKPVYASFL